MKKTSSRAKLKASIIPDEVQDQNLAPEAGAEKENLETVRLSFGSKRGKPTVSYAPEISPLRFTISDSEIPPLTDMPAEEEILQLTPDDAVKRVEIASDKTVWYAIGMVLAVGWVGFSLVFAQTNLLAAILEYTQAALPGIMVFFAFGMFYMLDRQEKSRSRSWQQALENIFNIEDSKLQNQAREAKALARNLSDVQLQMRGVNTQLWVLQKNIGDIDQLKSDLEYLGQEISTFSTVSRRTIIDWESQLLQSGQQLEHLERTTQRLSHDSLETCSFLSDRIEEVNEQITSLNDLQNDASDGTRRLGDVVKTARDDMKDLITQSREQSEAAAIAQTKFRDELKNHVADLAKELEALGGMCKAFDSVRADMGQASIVLSRGVRESLMDVKLLLDDWKQTKTQLESVLSTATHRMSTEFEEQLVSAKSFLSEWDYMLNSRLGLLTEAQAHIQQTLEEVPQSLQITAKAVLRDAPDLIDKMSEFRHAAASMQQSVFEAQNAADKLAAVAPDLSGFKKEVTMLAEVATKARADLLQGLANVGPEMRQMNDVTIRASNFFDNLQGKATLHVSKLAAMEELLKRLQAPMAVSGVMDQLQPVIRTLDKLNERCDDLEKRAASTRSEFESLDLKPLMKKMVLDIEAVFDQSIDVLSAVKPLDSALRNRDDLPALTIRLRQVLEAVKPEILSSVVKNKQSLREAAHKFTARFGTICEEARASSPQGEWVATALASSELGKIYRLLQKGLEN